MNQVGKECWEKPLIHPCIKIFEEVTGTCLKIILILPILCRGTQNAIQHIVFEFTRMEPNTVDSIIHLMKVLTYFKYNKVSNIAGASFRTKIVAKRNDPQLNRHNNYSCKGVEQKQVFS